MARRPDPRKLKDQAQEAVNKGKYKKALEAYQALELAEPKDGAWSRRAGEMHRYLNAPLDAIAAFRRAAEKYSSAGFLVKAIAVVQMILRIDPAHSEALNQLATFNAARGMPAAAAEPPMTAPVSPVPEGARTRTIPPGASLDVVALRDVIPGSASSLDEKVFDIPIELDLDELVVDDGDDVAHEALVRTPLFSELRPAALQKIIERVTLRELKSDEVLFHQGDAGAELYVIAEGQVAVIDEGPPRTQLASLGEGAFFGEISLVTTQPRAATIVAVADTQLLEISRDVLADLVEEEPEVLTVLLRFLRDRLLDNLTHTNSLFAPFAGEEREHLCRRFRFLESAADAVLVRQGEPSNGLYIVLAGAAEVHRSDDGHERRLATLGAGDLFGEMSLLSREPAVATVRTTGKCYLLMLPAADFREIIMTHPQVLMFVGDLAEERKRKFAAIADGQADYEEGRLELF